MKQTRFQNPRSLRQSACILPMNQFILRALASVVAISCGSVHGYEIPNHADMTQRALLISKLGTDVGSNGKLVPSWFETFSRNKRATRNT